MREYEQAVMEELEDAKERFDNLQDLLGSSCLPEDRNLLVRAQCRTFPGRSGTRAAFQNGFPVQVVIACYLAWSRLCPRIHRKQPRA